MNILAEVLALIQLAPSILQLIVQVEAIFGGGNGAAKKAVVMSAVAPAPAGVLAHVGAFVDSTVATLNTAGVLKKSA